MDVIIPQRSSSLGSDSELNATITYSPHKFRTLKAVLRFFIFFYAAVVISRVAVFCVAYDSNIYMDIRIIAATCFLAFSWSLIANLVEIFRLIRLRTSKSWAMWFDLTSIWLTAGACIYIACIGKAYQNSTAIHDDDSKPLLDALHLVTVLSVILAVAHVPLIILTLVTYYLQRRAYRPDIPLNLEDPRARSGNLPLIDMPTRAASSSTRRGATTPDRPIVFPSNTPSPSLHTPFQAVLPPLYEEPPEVV